MLVITFGRAASQELRERVRDQLVEAERALAHPRRRREPAGWSALLAQGDDGEIAARRKRLRDALADFDAATIATTHQFCQSVLRSLGVAGDTDSGAELVDRPRRPRGRGRRRRLPASGSATCRASPAVQARGRAAARPRGRRATRRQSSAPPTPSPAARPTSGTRFAETVRAEIERRKRRLGILSLRRPADPARRRPRGRRLPGPAADAPALADRAGRRVPGHRPGAVEGARPRLLGRGHDGAHRRPEAGDLRLPRRRHRHLPRGLRDRGDPAHAGDQLAQRRAAGRRAAGAARWCRPRRPADRRPPRRGPPPAAAGCRRTGRGPVARPGAARPVRRRRHAIDAARTHIAHDLADDVARLLSSGATFDGEPVGAGDVAVLIYSLKHVGLFQQALSDRGIPSVVERRQQRAARPRPAPTGWCCSRRWSSRTARRGSARSRSPRSSG